MSRNKHLYLIIALVFSVWIHIEELLFSCETSMLIEIIFWISIVAIIYGFYHYFKLLKRGFFGKDWVFMACVMFVLLSNSVTSRFYTRNSVNKYGGIVKSARLSRIREGNRSVDIYISYSIGGKTIEDRFSYDRAKLWKLKEGDTMLVVCPINCTKRSLLYKDFPTQQEIELCRDSAFYINGKLISEEEYHSNY